MSTRDQAPNWQPISALSRVASVIDGQLAAVEDQHRMLVTAASQPYSLNNATVERVARVFGETAEGLWLYDEQLRRWSDRPLTPRQRAEVERLGDQVGRLREVVGDVLDLPNASALRRSRPCWPRATSNSGSGGWWEMRTDLVSIGVGRDPRRATLGGVADRHHRVRGRRTLRLALVRGRQQPPTGRGCSCSRARPVPATVERDTGRTPGGNAAERERKGVRAQPAPLLSSP